MNKKGIVEDAFDYLFIAIAFFFILFFIGVFVSSTNSSSEAFTNLLVENSDEVTDLINQERVSLELNSEINLDNLNNQIADKRMLSEVLFENE
jgi:hypothetical protein